MAPEACLVPLTISAERAYIGFVLRVWVRCFHVVQQFMPGSIELVWCLAILIGTHVGLQIVENLSRFRSQYACDGIVSRVALQGIRDLD